MGLPQVLIDFKTQGLTAINRSARGIVALILKDDTGSFDTKVYRSIDEVSKEDWSDTNRDYIAKTFMGTPSKVIVERIGEEGEYATALQRLKNKKWNYMAIPSLTGEEVVSIATWIKTERNVNKRTFKAVLPNFAGDDEGIINFATNHMKVGDKTYSTAEYCCRIAGILSGLPFTRSATYYVLNEIEEIAEHDDPDKAIEEGKLILINDGSKIKIGRGVTSLTTTTSTKGEEFKKIKIVDAVDLVRDDIRDTFENHYVGKIVNSYDNKILFLAAINAYFSELQRIDVLDSAYDNKAEIDIEAQRLYVQSKGIDIEAMEEQEIKEFNTGSNVFAQAKIKFLDAVEDLQFTVYI